jgi:hemoglobin
MLRDIKNREDIQKLVIEYYERLSVYTKLEPRLKNKVSVWKKHLLEFVDFWEKTLLMDTKETQITIPLQISEEMSNALEQRKSFWLLLNFWIATVDDNFIGEIALKAKQKARNMYSSLYFKISEYKNYKMKNTSIISNY